MFMATVADAAITGCTFKGNTATVLGNTVYAESMTFNTCSKNEVCSSDLLPLVYSLDAGAPDYELCTGVVTEISPSC
jgi:hypothetical protein